MDTTGLAKDIEMIIKSLDDEFEAAKSETKANILDVSDEDQSASTTLEAFFKQLESEDGAATPNDLEFELEDLKNCECFRNYVVKELGPSMEGLERLAAIEEESAGAEMVEQVTEEPQNHEENARSFLESLRSSNLVQGLMHMVEDLVEPEQTESDDVANIPPMADESEVVETVAEPEKVEIEIVGGSEHNLVDSEISAEKLDEAAAIEVVYAANEPEKDDIPTISASQQSLKPKYSSSNPSLNDSMQVNVDSADDGAEQALDYEAEFVKITESLQFEHNELQAEHVAFSQLPEEAFDYGLLLSEVGSDYAVDYSQPKTPPALDDESNMPTETEVKEIESEQAENPSENQQVVEPYAVEVTAEVTIDYEPEEDILETKTIDTAHENVTEPEQAEEATEDDQNNGSFLETLRSSGLVQGIINMVEKIGEAEPEDFNEPAKEADIVNAEVSSAPELASIEIPSIVVTEASSWEPKSSDCACICHQHFWKTSTDKPACDCNCHGGESQQLTEASELVKTTPTDATADEIVATPSQTIPVDMEIVEFCDCVKERYAARGEALPTVLIARQPAREPETVATEEEAQAEPTKPLQEVSFCECVQERLYGYDYLNKMPRIVGYIGSQEAEEINVKKAQEMADIVEAKSSRISTTSTPKKASKVAKSGQSFLQSLTSGFLTRGKATSDLRLDSDEATEKVDATTIDQLNKSTDETLVMQDDVEGVLKFAGTELAEVLSENKPENFEQLNENIEATLENIKPGMERAQSLDSIESLHRIDTVKTLNSSMIRSMSHDEIEQNPSAASSTTSGKLSKRPSRLNKCLSRISSIFRFGSGKN